MTSGADVPVVLRLYGIVHYSLCSFSLISMFFLHRGRSKNAPPYFPPIMLVMLKNQ